MLSIAAVLNRDPTMIADRFPRKIGRTVTESTPWWPARPDAAAKTPNVLVMLFDDVGFADLGRHLQDDHRVQDLGDLILPP